MRAVAHHGTRSTDVAVKILPSDGSDQAARELRREVELQREAGKHPSIVKLLGCFAHDGSAWLSCAARTTSDHDKGDNASIADDLVAADPEDLEAGRAAGARGARNSTQRPKDALETVRQAEVPVSQV